MQQSKPVYTATVEGTAWFDGERGIVVKQEHRGELSERWTGRFDKNLAMEYRDRRELVDDVRSTHITARLITEAEAKRLIEEGEKARQIKAVQQEAEAARRAEVESQGPRWKYFVRQTTTSEDRLQNKEERHTSRAVVYFGAGARQAGGQIKAVPQVVYVDERNEPLAEQTSFLPVIQPASTERFDLLDGLPDDYGSEPNLAVPNIGILNGFGVLPFMPEGGLRPRLSWQRTLYVRIGMSEYVFPVVIDQDVTGYRSRCGRKCAVIEYTIGGEWKSAEHIEELAESVRSRLRGEYSLEGGGTVFYDPAERIVVAQDQDVTWNEFGQQRARLDDGSVGWETTEDHSTTATIHVELLPGGPYDVGVVVYILGAGVVVLTAGAVVLLRKRTKRGA